MIQHEMVVNSGLGVQLDKSAITRHLHPTTKLISEFLDINPLRLISSGALLICSDVDLKEKIPELQDKITKIGNITEETRFLIDGEEFEKPQPDEIIKGLKKIEELKKAEK